METTVLLPLIDTACRTLLSAQDRDRYSPTYGCFDRRYWGWKLVDFPEATFQRNVYPLAWCFKNSRLGLNFDTVLIDSISAGLQYAAHIQHADGSFDQAFPNEHSWGATAFLLHPMLEAFRLIRDLLPDSDQQIISQSLRRSAEFLCRHKETHAHIANHLAGGALSLYAAADLFTESQFTSTADSIVSEIIQSQSVEGWFVEYEGADPGYQSLCMYYLGQIYKQRPSSELKPALERAVNFMSHFIHPDGTYGGEYGSRRTSVYYPGGVAVLANELPMAASMTWFMLRSMKQHQTVTVQDVDMGNVAPLLSSYLPVLDARIKTSDCPPLPCEQEHVKVDFPGAGLFVRGTRRYYAVFSAGNGGVLKVFDRKQRSMLWNDAGYVGQDSKDRWLTTQMTVLNRPVNVSEVGVTVETSFYTMRRELPDPFRFLLLRLLNLTVMRSIALGNRVKSILANMLVVGKDQLPLRLKRTVRFFPETVIVHDEIRKSTTFSLKWLSYGQPFVSIHMASAKYFEHEETAAFPGKSVPVDRLNREDVLEQEVTI